MPTPNTPINLLDGSAESAVTFVGWLDSSEGTIWHESLCKAQDEAHDDEAGFAFINPPDNMPLSPVGEYMFDAVSIIDAYHAYGIVHTLTKADDTADWRMYAKALDLLDYMQSAVAAYLA